MYLWDSTRKLKCINLDKIWQTKNFVAGFTILGFLLKIKNMNNYMLIFKKIS